MHGPVADLQDEEHGDPLECHRAVHMEEVARQHGRGLGAQELPPGRVGVPDRCRRYPQPLEDTADRRRSHAVTEFEQLALDSLYPQLGFSRAMRSINETTASSTGGRPTRFGYVHFLAIRRRCQRRIVPGVTKRCPRSILGRAQTSAANTARFAQSGRGFGLALRNTATS
jgi:hypothetical protein